MASVQNLLMRQTLDSSKQEDENYEGSFVDPNAEPAALKNNTTARVIDPKRINPGLKVEEKLALEVLDWIALGIEDPTTRTQTETEIAYRKMLTEHGQNIYIPAPDLKEDVKLENEEILLAKACGNCALSYGTPARCALRKIEVSALSTCADYLSPFELVKEQD